MPLDEDDEHARYDPEQVASYFAAAAQAALVLAEFRAPYRGRSTPVNAWAFYACAHPAPDGFAAATLSPASARWNATLGEYILDRADVSGSPDPHTAGVEFAHSAFRHACVVCNWDPALPASVEGRPPSLA